MSPGDVAWRRPRGGRVGKELWAEPRSGSRPGRAGEGGRGCSRSVARGAVPGTAPSGEGRLCGQAFSKSEPTEVVVGVLWRVNLSFLCSSAPCRVCRPRPPPQLLRAFGRGQWWRRPWAWASETLQPPGFSFPPGRQDLSGSNGGLVSVPEPCLEVPVRLLGSQGPGQPWSD